MGNLAWTVSWQDLKDHCRTIGPVTHADVMQESDGRSKGCGLVTFQNPRDADRAIQELHDSELHERKIFVREDREAGGGGGGGGGGAAATSAVYVGNLSWQTSWQDLKDHCKQAGAVLHADVAMEEDGRSKGYGLVQFGSARDAAKAIAALHDTELNGRKIFMREDREAGGSGCKLYVGNLTAETTWMDLKDLFREARAAPRLPHPMPPATEAALACLAALEGRARRLAGTVVRTPSPAQAGTVVRADVVEDRDGNSKGFATVEMGSTRDAAKVARHPRPASSARPPSRHRSRAPALSLTRRRAADSYALRSPQAIQLFNDSEFNGRNLDVRPDAFA